MSMQSPATGCKGFTLIEVLVAMLVIAVGMLGVAALQFKGLQYSHDAYIRSQINFLAYDIAERIRLNRANADDYVANYTVPTTAPTGCYPTAGSNAMNDLDCWRQEVFYAIPPGSRANISKSGDFYTVTLGWTDRGGTPHNVSYTFQ